MAFLFPGTGYSQGPEIQLNVDTDSDALTLQWTSQANWTYLIRHCDGLIQGNWTYLQGGVVEGTGTPHRHWLGEARPNAFFDVITFEDPDGQALWDDPDNDRYTSAWEIKILGSDPFAASDADGDGADDIWETANYGNPNSWSSGDDPDQDGVSHLHENLLRFKQPYLNQLDPTLVQRSSYRYDKAGRLVQETRNTPTFAKGLDFGYDEIGNLVRVRESNR